MEIARTSMIHVRAPHFLWPYAVRCAAHQLNLWPYKLSARAILCILLGFPVDFSDFLFYHPPLFRFLDSRDVWFDESVSYYTRYPCRVLSVPPLPLFLAPSPPPAPAPPVPPSPPLVLPRQSPQQPSALPRHVTVDSWGVGAGGATTRGTRSGGAHSRGTRVGGASSGGAGVGVLGVLEQETRAGGTTTAAPTVSPHLYDTRVQARCHLERKEKERLDQERHELQQLDQQEQQDLQ
ncbi:unnamed protein product [Closterium sp. NIES-54]